MNESEKKLLHVLNTVKKSINEKYQKKWSAEEHLQCYTNEIAKLDIKIEYLKKDIEQTENAINNISPQLEVVEQQYKISKSTFLLSQQSLLNQSMHVGCLQKLMRKNKETGEKILNDFSQQLEKAKEELENNCPTYKIFKEKKTELDKRRYNIKMLQFKIKEHKRINKQKIAFQQKIFYSDCILLAKAWVEREQYDRESKKLKELETEERELMKKMMDNLNQIREMQKSSNTKKIERNRKGSKFILEKLSLQTSALSKHNDQDLQKTVSKNFRENFSQLFKQTATNNFQSLQSDSLHLQNLNDSTNNQHEIAPISKFTILENKILKYAMKENNLSKEEKNKALEAKFQQVLQNSITNSNSDIASKLKSFRLKEKMTNEDFEKNKTDVTNNQVPNSGSLGENQNVNILSQDKAVIDMLSQESNRHVKSKLNDFKFDSELGQSKNNVVNAKIKKNRELSKSKIFKQIEVQFTNDNKNQPFTLNDPKTEKKMAFCSLLGINDGPNNKLFDNNQSPRLTNNISSHKFDANKSRTDANSSYFKQTIPMVSGGSTEKQQLQGQSNFLQKLDDNVRAIKRQKMEEDKQQKQADPFLPNYSMDSENFHQSFTSQNINEMQSLKMDQNQYHFGNMTQFIKGYLQDESNEDFVVSPNFDTDSMVNGNRNINSESNKAPEDTGFNFSLMNETAFQFQF